MNNLTERSEWQALAQHQRDLANQHMRDWFKHDESRLSRFSLQMREISLNYSRNRITDATIDLLCELAYAVDLPGKIQALFSGHPVNQTEQRPALHTALRDMKHTPIIVNGENIAALIQKTREDLYALVDSIHAKRWLGATGKPIQSIVNIGIGGSCLGPLMATHALKDFAVSDLSFHFVSSVDESLVNDVLKRIDPETTLFIVSSKSFGTLETLTNARTIANWMRQKLGATAIERHFVAITAATDKAQAFGIPTQHIFPLWDWVGGRYSIWSAIGLPLMLMIGRKHFDEFLQGAFEMDQHFKQADFKTNMPVIFALLGIWYLNFFHTHAQAICPYSHRLHYLMAYLQQADMESNGKSTSLSGQQINYATGPVIFGGEGCDGQHAYHQLLLQGQHIIPVDFILARESSISSDSDTNIHQDILVASCFSQAQALMRGKTFEEARDALLARGHTLADAEKLAHHQTIPGNKPSNILLLDRINPQNLGALLALYEHKIFVQGAIWDINSFDQWGVELGKQLLPPILERIRQHDEREIL